MQKIIVKLILILTLILGTAAYQDCSANTADVLNTRTNAEQTAHTSIAGVLFKKLLIALLGVGCSACAIYLLLTLYARFRPEALQHNKIDPQFDENSFATPNTIENAIKLFLNKLK